MEYMSTCEQFQLKIKTSFRSST